MKKTDLDTSESLHSSTSVDSKECRSKYKLVVVDFDWTMINCHSHNKAVYAKQSPVTLEENKGLILDGKAYGTTKIYHEYNETSLEEWATGFFEATDRFNFSPMQVNFFRELLADGVQVVIASHTKYPKIIDVALVKMGFTLEEIGKIHVICGAPLDEKSGKNEHIDLAMKLASVESYEDVLLIDDSNMNLRAAGSKNIGIVKVHPMRPFVYDARVACGYIEEEDDESTDYGSDDDLIALIGADFGDEEDSEHSDDTVEEMGCFSLLDSSKDGNL